MASLLCQTRGDIAQLVRKRGRDRGDEFISVVAPTDVDLVDVDAVCHVKSIAEARSGVGRDTEAPVFSRSSSLQAIGDI